jgi:Putative MetA-pathway of phenol degradation
MQKIFKRFYKVAFLIFILSFYYSTAKGQTDIDAIMMSKNNFCTGIMYGQNSWKNYWEGTFKRDNQNLGTVSSQMIGVMGNYGLKDNLNLLFAVPYISTKASQGTLAGFEGLQDLTLTIKWMPIEKKWGKGDFSLYTLGAVSTPISNYVADYLPLSIGLRSKTATLRLMMDYQVKNLFVTGSAAYIMRNKVTIDRTSYYTTEMVYSNQVAMPNMANFNLRAGYRSSTWIAETVLDIMQTNGGFDISKNNMPFLSNQMNATRVGANIKYTLSAVEGLSFIGNAMFTTAGRNVGQTTSLSAGVFYILDFTKKKKASKEEDKK